MSGIVIRTEEPRDVRSVHALVEAAFGQADEADLVDALRDTIDAFVSFVAVEGEVIVGHVAFSPVTIEGYATDALLMGLGPMAVTPPRQNDGIGTLLAERSLQACRERGVAAVVVLGHPAYYPRFGFTPASRFALRFPAEVPDDAFMALELVPGALESANGVVRYAPPFDALT